MLIRREKSNRQGYKDRGDEIVNTALIRDFKQTVTADLRSREYRAMYLAETIAALHDGEFAVGKRMLCKTRPR